MAFVASVVAWINRATRPAGTASSASTLAIPSSTARSGSWGVVSTLAVVIRPAPRTRTTSVKVPPMSTPSSSRSPDVALRLGFANVASAGPIVEGFEPGIEDISQAVAQEAHADRDEHDGDSGKGRDPPGVLDVFAALAEHSPPRRRGRRNAEPEEAQGRLGEDDPGQIEGQEHDQRIHHVRQDVARDDPGPGRPEGPGALDEFPLPEGPHRGADGERT